MIPSTSATLSTLTFSNPNTMPYFCSTKATIKSEIQSTICTLNLTRTWTCFLRGKSPSSRSKRLKPSKNWGKSSTIWSRAGLLPVRGLNLTMAKYSFLRLRIWVPFYHGSTGKKVSVQGFIRLRLVPWGFLYAKTQGLQFYRSQTQIHTLTRPTRVSSTSKARVSNSSRVTT